MGFMYENYEKIIFSWKFYLIRFFLIIFCFFFFYKENFFVFSKGTEVNKENRTYTITIPNADFEDFLDKLVTGMVYEEDPYNFKPDIFESDFLKSYSYFNDEFSKEEYLKVISFALQEKMEKENPFFIFSTYIIENINQSFRLNSSTSEKELKDDIWQEDALEVIIPVVVIGLAFFSYKTGMKLGMGQKGIKLFWQKLLKKALSIFSWGGQTALLGLEAHLLKDDFEILLQQEYPIINYMVDVAIAIKEKIGIFISSEEVADVFFAGSFVALSFVLYKFCPVKLFKVAFDVTNKTSVGLLMYELAELPYFKGKLDPYNRSFISFVKLDIIRTFLKEKRDRIQGQGEFQDQDEVPAQVQTQNYANIFKDSILFYLLGRGIDWNNFYKGIKKRKSLNQLNKEYLDKEYKDKGLSGSSPVFYLGDMDVFSNFNLNRNAIEEMSDRNNGDLVVSNSFKLLYLMVLSSPTLMEMIEQLSN